MKAIRVSAVALALFAVSSVAAQSQTPYNLHEACFTSPDGTLWVVSSNDQGTTLTRTSTDGASSSKHGTWVPETPAYGQPWTQGQNAANKLIDAKFFPTESHITYATWTHDDYSRADIFNFTDGKGASVAFVSTACAGWANCRGAGGTTGKHCFTEYETCCGAGTMFPSCIMKDSSDQCCTWYLAAAQCNSSQTCCGMMGPGASSYAYCCNQGSTCCTAQVGYSGTSTCCPEGSKCCQGSSVGLCCGADEVCEPAFNRCAKANSSSTAAP